MDRAQWLVSHPFLAQISDYQARVDAAFGGPGNAPATPDFARLASAYAAGTPLLQAEPFRREAIEAGAARLAAGVEKLAEAPLPDALLAATREIRDRLRAEPKDAFNAVEWVANGGTGEAPVQPGLLRYLAWTALAAALAPAVQAFGAARDEEKWGRAICPTCGALPVMAALLPGPVGKERRLACGLCHDTWKYRRIGCPYCATENPDRLEVWELENEGGLRLDGCKDCTGYVKTVDGAEPFLLQDWPTIHVDAVAKEKGYRRMGASLYEL